MHQRGEAARPPTSQMLPEHLFVKRHPDTTLSQTGEGSARASLQLGLKLST